MAPITEICKRASERELTSPARNGLCVHDTIASSVFGSGSGGTIMGCIYRPTYTMKGPDGTRIRKVSPNWAIQFVDAHGKLIRKSVGPSKKVAQDLLGKLEAEVCAEKNGLPIES